MANVVSEYKTVQNPLVRYAEEVGRTYVSPSETVALGKGAKAGCCSSRKASQECNLFCKKSRTLLTGWSYWTGGALRTCRTGWTREAERMAAHESRKAALQDLFKTTLNKLMTGEIRVKDLDINESEVER